MRGTCAGFSGAGGSATGADGFSAAGALGFTTTAFAGAAGLGGSATGFAATGRAGAGGCDAASLRSVIAFSTSPGFEIFDRSIFGL